MAVKTLNDSARPNCLVLTLLMFVVMLRIPVRPTDMPGQTVRINAMEKARGEIAKMIAASRTSQALRSNVSSATIQ